MTLLTTSIAVFIGTAAWSLIASGLDYLFRLRSQRKTKRQIQIATATIEHLISQQMAKENDTKEMVQ
jgi:hypothetical protein